MLLNSNEYTYTRFKQARGHDGDSGKIYLGTPVKTGLVPILVKSTFYNDAINEYIGCNLGQNMGINTPRAWLFDPEFNKKISGIDFKKAVAVEYLDGLVDCTASYEPNYYKQTMNGEMLHLLLGEADGISHGLYQGQMYTFDFATSLYPEAFHNTRPVLNPLFYTRLDNGFLLYRHISLGEETYSRRQLLRYVESLVIPGIFSEEIISIYEDFKKRFLEYYDTEGYMDLIEELELVFSSDIAEVTTRLFGGMQQALVSI